METVFPVDLGRIAQDLQIRKVQVESVVQLMDEGNTVPFITRYRKERTGGLNEVQIREIQGRVQKLRDLNDRKQTILKAIESQGKLSEDLRELIRVTDNPKKLEDLYLPYKPKKRSKATEAREKGLEPLALRIWNRDESLMELDQAAGEFLNPEKGLETTDQVKEGVKYILAEAISELALIRDSARKVVWRLGKLASSKVDGVDESKAADYRDYFAYGEPVQHIPPHRILAFNRGEKEHVLKIKLDVPQADFERAVIENLPIEGHPQASIFREAALDSLERLLRPSLEREVRRDLSEMAEKHAVEVFARNLRSLLLQPPVTPQVTLAIDPGFRTGCKVAVLDEHGNILEHTIIYPHAPQNRRHESKMTLKDLVGRHKVQVVAIGNGTACRETEELVAEVIAEGSHFHENGITVENYKPPVPEPAPVVVEVVADQTSESAPEPTAEPATEATPETPVEVVAEAAPEAQAESVVEVTEVVAEPPVVTDTIEEVPPPISGGSPDEDEPSLPSPETQLPEPATAHEAQLPAPESAHEAQLEAPATAHEAQLEAPEATAAEATEGEVVAEEATTGEASAEKSTSATAFSSLTSLPKGMDQHKEPEKPREEKKKEHSGKREKGPRGPKPQPPQPPLPPAPHVADPVLSALSYVIVNESGASVYSTSNQGREEFPDYDATLRSVISIGRRLLDPLAELVKIDPQNIGVGLYQHDVSAKTLKEALESVVESCVNFVGVDMNTASVPLLRHVAGLNQLTARRVVEHRLEKGAYKSRDEVQQIEGVGPITFTQAAGFLRIRDAANPLDDTWVHPESYEVASKLLEKIGFTVESIRDKDQLSQINEKLAALDIEATATEMEVGAPTLADICSALSRPGRDPREDLPKPIFKRGILKIEDLLPGMELKGTVLNVVDFGAFVDIGLKDSGLVHISQLANRYIKSPHDVVSVGDVVNVWVLAVDNDRKRVSLTMVAPGTERERERERPRGPEGGGPRRERSGGPDGGEGGGDRGGRGPRRDRGGQGGGGTGGGDRGGRGPQTRRDGGGGQGGGGQYQGGGGGGGGRNQERSRFGRGAMQSDNRSGGGGGGAPQQRTNRPPRPQQPPKPLSEKEITGAVPLRSFGQLKQFFENKGEAGENQGDSPAKE